MSAAGVSSDRARLLAADRAARHLAQTEFVRPVALEAGAGTGKTTTLVARLLAWTLGPGWERAAARLAERTPSPPAEPGKERREGRHDQDDRIAAEVLRGVVAITFTEAAAAEMAHRAARDLADVARSFGRVPGWLEEASLPPEAERVRRARALLSTLDHLSVSTIHAFCRRLLAEHPLEAGVHPLLQVDADGRILDEVVRETVEAALREGYGVPGEPSFLILAARGLGPRELVEALLTLARAGLPAAALAGNPLEGPAAAALAARLLAAARDLSGLLSGRLSGRSPNAEKIAFGLSLLPLRLGGSPVVGLEPLAAALAELLPDNLLGHLGKWEKGDFGKAEAAGFGEAASRIAAAAGALRRSVRFLAGLDAELLSAARGALGPLLTRVEESMRTRGAATFQSLLDGAARLLDRHPAVRRQVRRGIEQLLVDEFQDTDETQCRILAALSLDAPGADPDAARPGLFLVGDPKQSIYGWRSADLAAYDGFVERLRASGGAVLPLAENFRSVPAILDEVERAVAPVMLPCTGLQPAFQPLLPCAANAAAEGFAAAGRRPVEHWVLWRPEAAGAPGLGATPLTHAAELEAAAVARDLADLALREKVPWSRFGILLRSFGQVDVVLEALRAARIPFAVGRDRQYYRRREVIEAAALARTVLDPGDHLALLTFLRSPCAGVPDAALIPLWNQGFPRLASEIGPRAGALDEIRAAVRRAADATPGGVPGLAEVGGWAASLEAALEALAALRRSFARDPADRFVENLRRWSLAEAIEAARYLGPYRLANLDRFFRRLLDALEEEGDAGALLRVLRRSVAEALEAEEARPETDGEEAVAVLTIHGAKGLDFDHVYLLQTHKLPPPDDEAGTEAGRAGDCWEVRLFGAPSPGFAAVEAAREEVEAAERVRTLYVALTRAKVRLVVSGLWHERPAPLPPERCRSHLQLFGARSGTPDLPTLFAALETSGASSWTDDDGTLWRFPGLEPAGEAREGEAPAPLAALAGPAEIERASRRLAARREEAHRRQERPISAPASEEAHERLRELQEQEAERETAPEAPEAETPETRAPLDREAALAAGTAVHRALETWDLAAEPRAELARQRERLARIVRSLAGTAAGAAETRAGELLDRFAAGPLLGRLADLRARIVARELPVLLPPASGDSGPVGFVSGAIDLLYRDAGGRFVIADWKTDEVASEGEIAARAAVYAPQGAVYARAVREALGLPEAPRFELWFLAAGRVVEGPESGPDEPALAAARR